MREAEPTEVADTIVAAATTGFELLGAQASCVVLRHGADRFWRLILPCMACRRPW
ncbi:hypothetical protein SALBM135S_08768 [Streptomyces alboniger]